MAHWSQTPEASFVVPAYNEARLLARTLAAIAATVHELGIAAELIVVDDASTDTTADIARAHGARVVAANNRNIARTRNDGAREARGNYLFFVDADTLVNARVVGAALSRVRGGDVGGGSVFLWDERHRFFGRVIEWGVAIVTRSLRLACGCFVFARRDDFLAVGGFDGALSVSEEWALSRALGRRGRFRVLGEPVVTSGRKLASIRLRDLFWLALRALPRGSAALRDRQLAAMWYDNPPR